MQTDLSSVRVIDELATPQPQLDPKPDWHAPTITRIDIKRTMLGLGSVADCDGFGPPCT